MDVINIENINNIEDINNINSIVGFNKKESTKDAILLGFTDIIVDFLSKTNNINKTKLKKNIFDKFIKFGIFDQSIHLINTDEIKTKIMSILMENDFVSEEITLNDITLNINDNIISKYIFANTCYELIGSGSFANVYKIKNMFDDKCYAVKKIGVNCTDYIKILSEVKLMSELYDTNIVRYHTTWIETIDRTNKIDNTYKLINDSTLIQVNNELSLCSTDSTYDELKFDKFIYIQMELCKMTLKGYIANNVLTNEEKNNICLQICNGIKYIHHKNIIHRDLKLQNIFIADDNTVKIGDFGLATKIYDVGYEDVGTGGYIAPEVYEFRLYSYKSDMYSLGVIMLEIFMDFKTMMQKFLFLENIDVNKEIIVNNNIDKVIRSLLDKNPDNRMDIDMVIKHMENQFLEKLE